MNLDELRSVQSKERQKDSLQNLRPSFYREVGEYISELKAERERAAEAASDPFSSPEVGRLTDEIETAKDVVEAIYERRMGKLVKQASLAAAGMPADDEGLTEEEAELFSDLIDRIRANKGRVLDVLEWSEEAADGTDVEGESREPTPDDPGADAAGAEPAEPSDSEGVSVADAMGGDLEERSPASDAGGDDPTPELETGSASGAEGGLDPDEIIDEFDAEPGSGRDSPPAEAGTDSSHGPGSATPDSGGAEPDDEPDTGRPEGGRDRSTDGGGTAPASGSEDVDRVTVRITRDVGSILGVDDREYSLADDDVVTLPERNATPLLERDAAEPLE
ncbi:hypothetical protein [Saliphagus sp. LR7]|uniref:hypothetical protein n=1 Tax=Saliphagus sp. LR7 TaxID=2282654 RepID=UPI000DF805F1|nr:hypothetical protein [Saliphagus sp. LR7]